MNKNFTSFKVPESKKLIIKAYGNLDILGWEKSDVAFDVNRYAQRIEQASDGLHIVSFDDCVMNIPWDVSVEIEKCSGDARLRETSRPVKIEKVSGNLVLQNVDAISITKISGDCLASAVSGTLSIEKISGNLKCEHINGDVRVNRCNGDVNINTTAQLVDISSSGNIHLGIAGSSVKSVNLRASGDITLTIPADIEANYKLESKSERIKLVTAGQEQVIQSRRYETGGVKSGTTITLQSAGDIDINSTITEQDDMSALFSNMDQLWASLEEERKLKHNAKSNLDFTLDGDFEKRINEKIAEAQRKINDSISKIGFEWNDAFQDSHISEQPEEFEIQEKVTEQEKLMIIKMVQDGKLSVEEADKLLTALDFAAE